MKLAGPLASAELLVLVAGVAQAEALETLRDKSSGRMFAIRVTPAPRRERRGHERGRLDC